MPSKLMSIVKQIKKEKNERLATLLVERKVIKGDTKEEIEAEWNVLKGKFPDDFIVDDEFDWVRYMIQKKGAGGASKAVGSTRPR